MAGVTSAIIGGIAGLGGAAMSADAQRDAARAAAEAAEFRPFDFFGGGLGGINFEDGYGEARMSPAIERLLRGITRQTSSNIPGLGGVLNATGAAGAALPGLFSGADADIRNAYGMLSNATGAFGSNIGRLQQQIPGLLSQFRTDASAAGAVDDPSNFAINTAQGFLGQDVSSVIGDTLSRLRDQARPAEERAVNSRVQQLFNRGVLSSTSGARSLGELGLAQEMADIERQNVAETAGLNRFNALQSAGAGLLSQGVSGLLQGRQLNQNLASLGANVGFQGLGTGLDLANGLFGARQGLASALQNRGMNRINLAQGLFGFGQNADVTNINTAIAGLNSRLGANADLRNLIALGINAGGQQTAAGSAQANAIMSASGSPLGGFLSGIGSGLLEQGLGKILTPKDE